VKVPFNVNHFPNLVHHDMEKTKDESLLYSVLIFWVIELITN